jgi:pimeloyl-ACP methyl ester carboxylesterase
MVQHVTANGLKFAYLEEGEGPLVLLVHGFPDTARTWDHTRPALAKAGYRAVSPWTRGYAPTELPSAEAFDADTLGRDLGAIIEALGEESAVVVGHDWGASAAYSLAGLMPERVRKLVTLAIPHPAGIRPSLSLLWNVRHFFYLRRRGVAKKIRSTEYAYIRELVQRWSPAWDVPADELDPVLEAFAQPGCLEAALGYYRALSPGVPEGQRGKVKVPAVAFAGTDDIVHPDVFHQAARRYAAGYDVVTMPGGHFMHREHPERFNAELLRVLGDG